MRSRAASIPLLKILEYAALLVICRLQIYSEIVDRLTGLEQTVDEVWRDL
jgi:hypothetical protein